MDLITNRTFLGLFLLSMTFISTKPLLPETIATATLLKATGITSCLAVGGRIVFKAFNQIDQIHVKTLPQAEFCCSEEKDPSQQFVVKANPKQSLLQKIKNSFIFGSKVSKTKQSYEQDTKSPKDNDTKNYWNQTYIQAQQARGFLPKINNHYYQADTGDFWKGATAGVFVTSMSSMYLILKLKKS